MRTSPDDIDLAVLGRAVKSALPRVALLALVTGGMTAAVMMTMAPRYTSTATIEILSREQLDPSKIGKPASAGLQTDPVSASAMNTHVRNILSTDLTQKMSEQLALASRPEFNEALPARDLYTRTLQTVGLVKAKPNETDDDRVLAAYRSAMKVANIRETRNIQLEFTTTDPNFSADGANLLAKLYRDSLGTSRTTEISDTESKLATEKQRLEREVETADKAVTDFRSKADIFKSQSTAGAATTQNDDRLGQLTLEQSKASAARTEADARAMAAREQMRSGTAEANPDVQKSQIIPRLIEQRIRQERQVSELSVSLLPAHPRMRQVQGDLTALKKQIEDEVKKVVDGLERDARIAADKEASFSKQIAALKATIRSQSPADAQLKALEDTAKAKRAELERVKQAYEEARTLRQVGPTVEVRLVQEAKASNEKVSPKPGMFSPLVALATMLVGLAWAVTKSIVVGPPSAATPVRPADAAPPRLAAAPSDAASSPPDAMAAATLATKPQPKSDCETALAALLARETGSACRSVVAADASGASAAATALALAKGLAGAGKSVVLVDWSAQASPLSDLAGALATPGLAQLVQGDVSFDDVIQKLADSDASLVSAGTLPAETGVLFDADRANLVLDAMDEAFEHIVVFADPAAARELFAATQGRFDAGVVVSAAREATGERNEFLGFDVGDLPVYRVHVPLAPQSTSVAAATRRAAVRAPAVRKVEAQVRG